jgi:TrmH family RNA methyltransferase
MIRKIESEDNARIKYVRKLHRKKYRNSEKRFIIEGINLFREAVERGAGVETVFVSDDFLDGDIRTMIAESGADAFEVSRNLYEKISDAENGSGILAVVRRRDLTGNDLISIVAPGDNVLVLDRLQDPGNIGTMIRTAAAAGYRAVIALKGTADVYSSKVLRSTAGMIFDMPVMYVEDAAELQLMLRRLGKKTAVTDPACGRPYYECDLGSDVALVIGNEGRGVSDELMEMADERVNIPMRGGIESLNAAVSAAILMYEAVRKADCEK